MVQYEFVSSVQWLALKSADKEEFRLTRGCSKKSLPSEVYVHRNTSRCLIRFTARFKKMFTSEKRYAKLDRRKEERKGKQVVESCECSCPRNGWRGQSLSLGSGIEVDCHAAAPVERIEPARHANRTLGTFSQHT